jgi:hypothetical protein
VDSINPDHPLRHLFAGLVEHTFCTEVGLCNPELTEYLADLLVKFTHVDRLRAISNAHGKELERIAGMLSAMEDEDDAEGPARDQRMYRHIGDYTLFWAGVYPEQLKRETRVGHDVLLSYVSQGKRSYAIVSELTGDNDVLPASLFRDLSDDFEHCLYGLGLVRRGWENPDRLDGTGGDLVL